MTLRDVPPGLCGLYALLQGDALRPSLVSERHRAKTGGASIQPRPHGHVRVLANGDRACTFPRIQSWTDTTAS